MKFCSKQRESGCFLLCAVGYYTSIACAFQPLLPSMLDLQVLAIEEKEISVGLAIFHWTNFYKKKNTSFHFSILSRSAVTNFNEKHHTIWRFLVKFLFPIRNKWLKIAYPFSSSHLCFAHLYIPHPVLSLFLCCHYFLLLSLKFWFIFALFEGNNPSLSVVHLKTAISFIVCSFVVIYNGKPGSVLGSLLGREAEGFVPFVWPLYIVVPLLCVSTFFC